MKIYVGDIAKIKTDVIVNAADTDFTPGGGIARWIFKQAGKEALTCAPGKVGEVCVTGGGSLPVKSIFHIPTVDWKKDRRITVPEIHTTVTIAINKALELGYKSIVFPLLGAGTLGLSAKEVAEETMEAILHMEEEAKFEGGLSVFNKDVLDEIKGVVPANISVEEI